MNQDNNGMAILAGTVHDLAEKINTSNAEANKMRNALGKIVQDVARTQSTLLAQIHYRVSAPPPMANKNLTLLSAYMREFRDWMRYEGLTDEASAARRFLNRAFTGVRKEQIEQILSNG